ncbi:MAG TPA: aspartate carbamoyltransferase regulatory subunit [Nitrososphaeraceae archaeon]|jgi:aspartate carbamoyltransferase regulatory subunit|nr:aspartate carbamoyltransferase regulatory subunit [Nitrososphaeraceae archaeon]HEX5976740.1 aspartate carbamoyltransferase regulatory subunit [Nitrososphaeraceae archaeon]HEX6028303.1 aspartate carbamoyltransferase regulatory subunit [Nitrososphaeraceae archaeon]HZB17701.1 aspartate carbamoyltransferase regulatory subunit [Nitrososphaeraceae archaeon]
MSDTRQLLVRRIKDGTVIDHIESGKALLVLRTLDITGKEGNVITVALNVPSSKHDKKDIIKVENKFLEKNETNKLALIAPHATINIIKEYRLVEKRKIQLPDSIIGVFKCPNLKCVTNSDEYIKPVINIIDKEKIVLRCRYCFRTLTINELVS